MISQVELPDIPRLYTAFAEWFACLICIYPVKKQWYYQDVFSMLIGLIGQILLQLLVSHFPLIMWVPGMFINIIWMLLFIWYLTKMDIKMISLVTVKSFIVSELLASLTWQFYLMIIWKQSFDKY